MTFPIFAAGDVLGAADMNAVGLWKITTQSLTGTATNVVGCFSTNYDRYLIQVDELAFSGAGDLYFQWLSGTTPLASAAYMWAWTGITVGGAGANSSSSSQALGYLGITNSAGIANAKVSQGSWTVYGPMDTSNARQPLIGQTESFPGDWASRNGMSQWNGNVAPHDGIRFLSNSAATMDGRVTIYGYKK
jgi:hypothetical protein